MENLNEIVEVKEDKPKLNGNGQCEKPSVNEEDVKEEKEKINS